MFELTIMQKRLLNGHTYDECQVYYFKADDIEEMFNVIETLLKAARNETEYIIREIEEGQIDEE